MSKNNHMKEMLDIKSIFFLVLTLLEYFRMQAEF